MNTRRFYWRVGLRVPVNVYDGDRPVCQCHTVRDALQIVHAVNEDLENELTRRLRWTLGPVTEQRHAPRADKGPIMLQLTDSQQCVLSIQPVDAKGLEAPVFGTPVWSSSDATVATVNPHSGGLAVDLVAVKPGTTQISVTAQVDEAADALTGTLDVTVVGGQAVALTIGNTAPTAQ